MSVYNLLLIPLCAFGLIGCLAASSKEIHLICENSIEVSELENQLTKIVQTHKFYSDPIEKPKKGELHFKGYFQAVRPKIETYLIVVIGQTRPLKARMMVTQYRALGVDDMLPREVLDVFDAIVSDINSRFIKNCKISNPR